MTFAEKLFKLRTDAKLSQKDLAQKAGLSQTAIYFWETGKRQPKIEHLQKIAEVLGIKLIDILKDTDIINFTQLSKTELENYFPMTESEKGNMIKQNRLHKEAIYHYSITKIENSLSKLNDLGQQEAVKRVEELTEIPRYTSKREIVHQITFPLDDVSGEQKQDDEDF